MKVGALNIFKAEAERFFISVDEKACDLGMQSYGCDRFGSDLIEW